MFSIWFNYSLYLFFIPIRIFGVIANSINIIIFWNHNFKEKIFTFLFIHSVSEFFYFLVTLLNLIPYCILCGESLQKRYSSQFIVIFIDKYLSSSFAVFSLFIEVLISLHRYTVVANYNLFKRNYMPLYISMLAIVASLIYTPELFINQIVMLESNRSTVSNYYKVTSTQFGIENRTALNYYSLVVNLVRGPVCVTILTVLNILTLNRFRKQIQLKKGIMSSRKSSKI
jgi:hypothetical protein